MKNAIFKTSFFLFIAFSIFIIACNEESLSPGHKTPEQDVPAALLLAKNNAYIALPGYEGTAQSSNDCPTGMRGCTYFDMMLMNSLDEGLQYLAEENPDMVLAKLTITSSESAKIEMVATGSEYLHNETEGDVLTVSEGGIKLSEEISNALGYASVTVLSGEYQIEEKPNPYFWSGHATVNISVASELEYIDLGIINEDGQFEFTVTQDQLENNFNMNLLQNFDQGGILEEAEVLFPDEENGLVEPEFHLRGPMNDPENSADITWPATLTENIVRIPGSAVGIGGICAGCPKCIAYQGGCKCIWGPWGQCKKTFNPEIYWYD